MLSATFLVCWKSDSAFAVHDVDLAAAEEQEKNVDKHGAKDCLSDGLSVLGVCDAADHGLMADVEQGSQGRENDNAKGRDSCAKISSKWLCFAQLVLLLKLNSRKQTKLTETTAFIVQYSKRWW